MKCKKKYERWYIKYLVNSSIIYYSYLIIFIGTFLIISTSLKLDIRKTYSARINGDQITVETDSEINAIDGKVYLYKNKNDVVSTESIKKTKYEDGVMRFYLNEKQTKFSGELYVEVTIKKQSLLSKIFLKAGKNDD